MFLGGIERDQWNKMAQMTHREMRRYPQVNVKSSNDAILLFNSLGCV